MSRSYNKKIVSIKPTSIAMVEGVLAGVLGLAVAILFALRTTVDIAGSTSSVLAGLTLGIASGAVAIFVVPFIYFGIGWLIGLVNGVVLNFLIETAGGIELNIADKK